MNLNPVQFALQIHDAAMDKVHGALHQMAHGAKPGEQCPPGCYCQILERLAGDPK